jgi:hypothetical protein
MAVRLEHANLTVRDIEGMIRFLQTAFPEFRVRGEGRSQDGSRWLHIGTQDTYIALSPAKVEPEKQCGRQRLGVRSVPLSGSRRAQRLQVAGSVATR